MASEFTPVQFIANWSRVELSERAASQDHFLDQCKMLGQPLPKDHDLTEKRKETDQRVLENLLRLNLERAGAELVE